MKLSFHYLALSLLLSFAIVLATSVLGKMEIIMKLRTLLLVLAALVPREGLAGYDRDQLLQELEEFNYFGKVPGSSLSVCG